MPYLIAKTFCLPESNPYSIRDGQSCAHFITTTRGVILMTFPPHPRRWPLVAAIMMLIAGCGPGAAQEQHRGIYMPPAAGTVHAVTAEHGMVVAQEKIAARIGDEVLKRGGNAIDAAVATGFAMAVTYPRAGNIGGGGFMIIHSKERGEDVAIE